jgi:hypothetical protein
VGKRGEPRMEVCTKKNDEVLWLAGATAIIKFRSLRFFLSFLHLLLFSFYLLDYLMVGTFL